MALGTWVTFNFLFCHLSTGFHFWAHEGHSSFHHAAPCDQQIGKEKEEVAALFQLLLPMVQELTSGDWGWGANEISSCVMVSFMWQVDWIMQIPTYLTKLFF